jgi:hypothetical protein
MYSEMVETAALVVASLSVLAGFTEDTVLYRILLFFGLFCRSSATSQPSWTTPRTRSSTTTMSGRSQEAWCRCRRASLRWNRGVVVIGSATHGSTATGCGTLYIISTRAAGSGSQQRARQRGTYVLRARPRPRRSRRGETAPRWPAPAPRSPGCGPTPPDYRPGRPPTTALGPSSARQPPPRPAVVAVLVAVAMYPWLFTSDRCCVERSQTCTSEAVMDTGGRLRTRS